ncbi:hypothetical protein ETAA8_49410 [Anatilimnocola aggregata]|uniref:Uncharacterized protein n=1 Tax=Anatilimnocola aggregata TaxID=2528021 RepID=A0A517YHY1_9BACT|nr:hypothetical protein [Anatilimnocola aggregata]QDU29826.1 hypothetical protein ETAA8_49410 [Anatilimnocola aggregata]
MRQWFLASSLGLALIAGGSTFLVSTSAAEEPTFWQRVKIDFHRNNAWPEPFQTADRAVTREPFCIMVNNGWKMQNTIGTYLFSPETQELNRAGELKVKWVITQAPIHRRAVFVLVGETPEDTRVRVESVQRYISRVMPEGHLPPVMLTHTEPEGASGEYLNALNNAVNSSIPAPRLPADASISGGSGSSGGN